MSEFHITDLRARMLKNHWVIKEELSKISYGISVVWVISRPDGSNEKHILFEGLSEESTLPLEKAYGIKLENDSEVKAYFGKKSGSWEKEINSFFTSLNSSNSNK